MLSLLIQFPWLAGVIGGVFVLLYGHSARFYPLVSGVAWLLYAAYEYGMKRRILCSGECNIRVDLLLIYPLLLVLSLVGVASYLSFLRGRNKYRTGGTGS